MIFDKIIEKVIVRYVEKLKDKIVENKDEIIAKVKEEISNYIEEHKDEILELAKEKLTSIFSYIVKK